nr:hypothetical transcript [Hymenolepis microstoma]
MVNGKGTRVNPFTAKNITLLRPNCHVADKKGLDDFGKRMRNRAKYGNFLDSANVRQNMVNGKGTRVNPFTAKNITLLRPNCHVADKKGLDDFGKRMRNRAKYGNFLDSVGDDYYGRHWSLLM